MKEVERKQISFGYFNPARGIGMLLIILGHSINLFVGDKSNTEMLFAGAGSVVGGGLMAAFFMISGFGFYTRSVKRCLAVQSRILLRPYWAVAAAVLLTKIILAIIKQRSFWKHGGELVLTYLLGLNAEGGGCFFGVSVESVSIFWFILALFVGWGIYNSLKRIGNEKICVVAVIISVILGYVITGITKVWPYCLPMGLFAVGYLASGEYIKKHDLLFQKVPFWIWFMVVAVVFFSAAFGEINMVACIWKLGIVDVCATFFLGFLFLRLYARFMSKRRDGKIIKLLDEVGFNSIWIVCLHAYEKIIFPWYRLADILKQYPIAGVFICFLLRCALMYLLYMIITILERKLRNKI